MSYYKYDADTHTLYSVPTVYTKTYSLTQENHTLHEYPVDGWWWFDTHLQAARTLDPDQLLPQAVIAGGGEISQVLAEKAKLALDANSEYLATIPTTAQALEQVKALTQQMNIVIRLILHEFSEVG